MLSDREQQMLRELEDRLAAQYPDFPRSFDVRAQRLGRPRLDGPVRAAIATVVSALCALMLVTGAPGGAVALATVTGLIWLGWRWLHGPAPTDRARHDTSST